MRHLPAHALLAEEVTDLHRAAGDGHVDGEMGVTEAHLVQVPLGHTGDHVVHVRADGADARELHRGGVVEVTGRRKQGRGWLLLAAPATGGYEVLLSIFY